MPPDQLLESTQRLSLSTADGEIQVLRARAAVASGPYSEESIVESDTVVPPAKKKKRRKRSTVLQNADDEGKKVHKKKLLKLIQPPTVVFDEDAMFAATATHYCNIIADAFTDGNHPKKNFAVNLENTRNLKGFVVCFVPGLSVGDFGDVQKSDSTSFFTPFDKVQVPEELSFFKNTFQGMVSTNYPSDFDHENEPFRSLTNVRLTKAARKDALNKLKQKKITIEDLLMTKEKLQNEQYPIHSTMGGDSLDEYVETVDFDHDGSRTFGLDCEFCRAATGFVLTRISLVNFQEEVVLDEFVKPDEEITDYVTLYSGVTEEKLRDVTVTLKDIQERLLSIVSSKDVLIGHSLDSDLNVLKMKHPRIVDTAHIYESERGPPFKPSLKTIAAKYLGAQIQQGLDGHSSIEDATSCVKLVKLKLIEGSLFGTSVDTQSVFELLNDKPPSSIIDYTIASDGHDTNVVKHKVTNDDSAIDVAINHIYSNTLTIVHLRELEHNLGWYKIPENYDGFLKTEESLTEEERKTLLTKLSTRLIRLYNNLPENTGLLVLTKQGDISEIKRLQRAKTAWNRSKSKGTLEADYPNGGEWEESMQVKLNSERQQGRNGVSFICIKS